MLACQIQGINEILLLVHSNHAVCIKHQNKRGKHFLKRGEKWINYCGRKESTCSQGSPADTLEAATWQQLLPRPMLLSPKPW